MGSNKCKYCGKIFRNSKKLKRHMRIKHTEELKTTEDATQVKIEKKQEIKDEKPTKKYGNFFDKHLLEALLIAAVFTSIFFLTFDKQPHYDSVRNLVTAQEITERGIPTYFDSVYWQHPPLFYYMVAFASMIFNIHIYYGAKIVVLLFAFLSLTFFYFFCKDLKDVNFARLSVLILALTPLFWYNANDIMQAMGEVFFFTSTLYFFQKAMKTDSEKYYILAGLFLGLGILERISAIVMGPVILLYFLIEKKKSVFTAKNIKNIFFLIVVAVIIFSPYQIYKSINGGPILSQTLSQILTGEAAWSETGSIAKPPFLYITQFFMVASFSTLFFVIGLLFFLKKREKFLLLPFLWFALSILILSMMSHKEYRFLIIALPAIVVITSHGILRIREYFRGKDNIFYIIPALLLLALSVGSITQNTNDGYFPFEFELWDYINNLDNDVIAKEISGDDVFTMPYGMIKLMTNKYSDFVAKGDINNDIMFAATYNTPYILYPRDPGYNQTITKMKFFNECNCSLYKVDESLLGGIELKTYDQENKVLRGVSVHLFDQNGNNLFNAKSNSQGKALLPVGDFVGIIVVQKICYNRMETIIKTENGILHTCEKKTTYEGVVPKEILECKSANNELKLSYRGCFNHQYPISRF